MTLLLISLNGKWQKYFKQKDGKTMNTTEESKERNLSNHFFSVKNLSMDGMREGMENGDTRLFR